MIEHVTESEWPEDTAMVKMEATYTQPIDNYKTGEEDNYLTIGTESGGYFYIKTDRWAFDTVDELIKVVNDFANRIKFAQESKVNSDNR